MRGDRNVLLPIRDHPRFQALLEEYADDVDRRLKE